MTLLPGEALSTLDADATAPSGVSDEQINRKYVKGEVRIVTEQARYPLNTIAGMVESADYNLP